MKKRDVKIEMKVRIVDKPRNFDNDCGFIPEMREYLGNEAIVKEIRNNGFFKLDIDKGLWTWDARWFNKVE